VVPVHCVELSGSTISTFWVCSVGGGGIGPGVALVLLLGIPSDGHDDLGVQSDLVLLGSVVPGKLIVLVGGGDGYPGVIRLIIFCYPAKCSWRARQNLNHLL